MWTNVSFYWKIYYLHEITTSIEGFLVLSNISKYSLLYYSLDQNRTSFVLNKSCKEIQLPSKVSFLYLIFPNKPISFLKWILAHFGQVAYSLSSPVSEIFFAGVEVLCSVCGRGGRNNVSEEPWCLCSCNCLNISVSDRGKRISCLSFLTSHRYRDSHRMLNICLKSFWLDSFLKISRCFGAINGRNCIYNR